MKPYAENDASGKVKENYTSIKTALDTRSLPLFFSYLGGFPEYLDYITHQLVRNLEDPSFISLAQTIQDETHELMKEVLQPSEELEEWWDRYSHSATFTYFTQDLRRTHTINIKLALIFIALREAVKGWAVAAKQLPENSSEFVDHSQSSDFKENFIFEYEILPANLHIEENTDEDGYLSRRTTELAPRPRNEMERNLLPEYLFLCQKDFLEHVKRPECLFLRVQLEQIMLASIRVLPHPIHSPINIVYELSAKYKDFPDLLYLLSEHFPTYAVQRMMFSGYMMKS